MDAPPTPPCLFPRLLLALKCGVGAFLFYLALHPTVAYFARLYPQRADTLIGWVMTQATALMTWLPERAIRRGGHFAFDEKIRELDEALEKLDAEGQALDEKRLRSKSLQAALQAEKEKLPPASTRRHKELEERLSRLNEEYSQARAAWRRWNESVADRRSALEGELARLRAAAHRFYDAATSTQLKAAGPPAVPPFPCPQSMFTPADRAAFYLTSHFLPFFGGGFLLGAVASWFLFSRRSLLAANISNRPEMPPRGIAPAAVLAGTFLVAVVLVGGVWHLLQVKWGYVNYHVEHLTWTFFVYTLLLGAIFARQARFCLRPAGGKEAQARFEPLILAGTAIVLCGSLHLGYLGAFCGFVLLEIGLWRARATNELRGELLGLAAQIFGVAVALAWFLLLLGQKLTGQVADHMGG